jgi:hypothetical protein
MRSFWLLFILAGFALILHHAKFKAKLLLQAEYNTAPTVSICLGPEGSSAKADLARSRTSGS